MTWLALSSTLYELITNDTHFANIPHWDQNIDMCRVSRSGLVIASWTLMCRHSGTSWMNGLQHEKLTGTWDDISMHRTDLHGRIYQQHQIIMYPLRWAKMWMERRFGERVHVQDAGQSRMDSMFFAGKGHRRAGYLKTPKEHSCDCICIDSAWCGEIRKPQYYGRTWL